MISASSFRDSYEPEGAVDGDRFSAEEGRAWMAEGGGRGWWQVDFAEPRRIGSILQIIGSHDTLLQNAPKRYHWRWSADGKKWHILRETQMVCERR